MPAVKGPGTAWKSDHRRSGHLAHLSAGVLRSAATTESARL